jgi:beta-glucosidase
VIDTPEPLVDRLDAEASCTLLSTFPPEFRFGTATAAYQIEGAVKEGGRGESIWDRYAHTPGLIFHGDTGDIACDHYHRWEADFDLMAELGIKHYRFSLSWARLQPSGRGPLNPVAVEFYRAQLQGLLDRGIAPLVTLYHWDLPQVLEDEGGWPNRNTAYLFEQYARLAAEAFADLAHEWVTINEPWCISILGYGKGEHAPGRHCMADAAAAAHHVCLAHGLAVAAMRQVAPHIRLGVTNVITDVVPASNDPADIAAAGRLDASSNKLFLDPFYTGAYGDDVLAVYPELSQHIQPGDLDIIACDTDFVGINHYHRMIASNDPSNPKGWIERHAEPATTSFGWSVLPESLEAILGRVSREYTTLPIFITESGASYHDYVDPDGMVVDTERVAYLRGYFDAAARALASGVNLQGYYVWSTFDNEEWAMGYEKRFGLIYVDYRTQTRIPKLSAHWFSREIAAHADLSTK